MFFVYQPMDEKIKTWTLRFPVKGNPNMEKALFDWPIVLRYDVKAKYRSTSTKFSGITFFHQSVLLNHPKFPRVCIYPFDKPIKSLYFQSFVVSVFFACFHFKVIRKSLYLVGFVVVIVFVVVVVYTRVGTDKVEGIQ